MTMMLPPHWHEADFVRSYAIVRGDGNLYRVEVRRNGKHMVQAIFPMPPHKNVEGQPLTYTMARPR